MFATRTILNTLGKRNFVSKTIEEITQGGMLMEWPQRKENLCVNICRQGEVHLIERFGKYLKAESPGLYLSIPLVERITVVDMREKAIPIEPQLAISRDNVSVKMSGVLYLRFCDPHKAAYGHFSPLFAVLKHSESAMRSAIGELELDSLFHDRTAINGKISAAIVDAAEKWGIEVLRYEVTEIMPDQIISAAMDRQARAERERREQVLKANGDKEAAILRSEGELQSRTNTAKASKIEKELLAQGNANAISKVAESLKTDGGKVAASLDLAKDYMDMMGEIGSKSNTIFFGEQQGDIAPMMARVAKAIQSVGGKV